MVLKNDINAQSKEFNYPHPFELESGRSLPSFTLAYETYGQLSAKRDNAILACHALTKDAHMAGIRKSKPGWWNSLIRPGQALDTSRYFLICINVLGGCGGSTGPASIHPETSEAYALNFPVLTISDMVRAQKHLIDELGIEQLHGIAGGCFGGMQALEWLIHFPNSIRKAIIISTTASTSAHTIALFNIMRRFIRQDPHWQNGNYYKGIFPKQGLTQSILLGIPIWMNRSTLEEKFGRHSPHPIPSYTLGNEFSIEAFLDQTAQSVARQFDPNSLLYLTRAQEYFDLPQRYGSLQSAFENINAELLFLSYDSDWRYPSEEMEIMHQVVLNLEKKSKHVVLKSAVGHGAFMYDAVGCGEMMKGFLEN